MAALTLNPDLRALAPDVASRVTAILTALAAVIARGLLRHPTYAVLILPLWRHLNRTARRFSAIMANLAAGRLPRLPTRTTTPAHQGGRAPRPKFPAERAWLVHTLRHEAAVYRNQLLRLLAEPGVTELLALAPAALRVLGPIRHALGVPAAPPRPAPPPPAPPPTIADLAAEEPPAPARPELPVLCPRLANRWPFRLCPGAYRILDD